jgi:phosphoglycolate phosphatase
VKRLILFDIDGTLVSKHQGHYEAFAVGFKDVFGINASMYMIEYHGKTDSQIITEVMSKSGIPEDIIQEKLAECIAVMGKYYTDIQDYLTTEVFDDVTATLTTLQTEDSLLGLITGNLEPIAHAKLGRADIDTYFRVGGFGNESTERTELVRIATKKAQSTGFEGGSVYVVGDTPNDITAALNGGATPIGVTTGIYGRQDLADAGAEYIVEKLGDIPELLEQIS